MGEVYLAEDTKLDRKIALKLLPDEFTKNQDRLHRFTQEAKAASALNHPNIITIYEIGQADDAHYIATEFIDGKTLRQHLQRHPLTVREVLDIAIQTAGALSAAHQAGIVHRDIKPENLMLRPDGYVKVLDFGLAKLTEKPPLTDDSDAATRLKVNTDPGTIMGTASYMSPEQARGLTVDARTDIFSLGVVIYEMIAGRVPFTGETSIDVIAAILDKPLPPLARFAPDAPTELQRIVGKALRKDKDERYQLAREMLNDLKELKQELEYQARVEGSILQEPASATTAGTAVERKTIATPDADDRQTTEASKGQTVSSAEIIITEIKRHKGGVVLAVLLILLLCGGAAFGLYKLVGQKPSSGPVPFQNMKLIRLATVGTVKYAAISPDSKIVAYISNDGGRLGLWIKQLAITTSNVQIVKFAPEEAAAGGLIFSPDNQFVYYRTNRNGDDFYDLYRVPVFGGDSKKVVTDIDSGMTFSPDGKRFAFVRNGGGDSRLMISNEDGNNQREITIHRKVGRFTNLAWSPDGKVIVCSVFVQGANSNIDLVSIDPENAKESPVGTHWYSVGRMEWLADGSGLIIRAADQGIAFYTQQIWLVPYPTGEPRKLTNDLSNYVSVSLSKDSNTLAAVREDMHSEMWILPEGDSRRARQIPSKSEWMDGYDWASWTADGRIALYSLESGDNEIWMMNADGTNRKQLTEKGLGSYSPIVSPDGRYIVFESDRLGQGNMWRMDIDGGNPLRLTQESAVPGAVTPDGQWVVYVKNSIVWKVRINGGEEVKLTDRYHSRPTVSPDGKLIASASRQDDGNWALELLPIDGGQPVQIIKLPQTIPFNYFALGFAWSPDGHAVSFIAERDGSQNVWQMPLDGGPAKQLTDFKGSRIRWFDWTRDGHQLLCVLASDTSDAVLINNVK